MRPILTAGGARFVKKEALAGISGARVQDDLWAAVEFQASVAVQKQATLLVA